MEEPILILPAPPSDYTGPQVFSLPARCWDINVEPFGKAYEDCLRVVYGLDKLELDAEVESAETPEDAEEDKKYQAHRKKSVLDLFTENHYDLLGLGHLGWKATQDDIRKAYRQAVLVHHPDKQAQASTTADDEVFKKIQKAYETLTNPKLKKAYDSQVPFDDSIPNASDVTSDEEFYKVFRWCSDIQVPGLGDEKTHIGQVNKFYAYWYSMKSWRDFSYGDEYDPEEAESREEKRWMERRNAKERQKKERDEANRIRNLVDLSYKLDPRIRKVKDQEQKEKEEARQKRLDIIRKKQEEEERKKREEREKEEAEQQRIQAEKEAEKNERLRITRLKKKKRTIIRQTARAHDVTDKVEYLCENLETDALSALATALTAVTDPSKETIEKIFQEHYAQKKREEEEKQAESDKKYAEGQEEEEVVVWTPEEVSLLTKAVIKFPGGTIDRWEKIKQFIGGDKTVKQIITRVRASQHGAQKATPTASPQTQARSTPQPSPQTPKQVSPQTPKQTTQPQQEAPASPATPPTSPASEAAWTPEEQKLLEDALKAFPASLGKDRWTKISEAVPGRSRRDCVERYKYLVSLIQKK